MFLGLFRKQLILLAASILQENTSALQIFPKGFTCGQMSATHYFYVTSIHYSTQGHSETGEYLRGNGMEMQTHSDIHSYTMDNLDMPNYLYCMSLVWGKKLE